MGEPPFYSDKDDDDHAANDDDVDGGDDDDDRSTRIREEPPFYFVLVSCPSSSPAALPACASSKSPTSHHHQQLIAKNCKLVRVLLLATTCFYPSLATICYHILPLELVMRLFFISTYAFRFMHIDKRIIRILYVVYEDIRI